MQDNLKPYPQYKNSGTNWLGKVPYNWNVTKLGAVFIERKEKVSDKDYSPLSVTKNGILPQLETAAKTNDGDNRKKVCEGDFVINSRSDRKGSSGLSTLTGSVSVISTVLQPNGYNNKYSHYLLKSQPFQEEFYRVGHGIVADLWSTKFSEMRSILTPIPGFKEQDQIVRYLDWKTTQISKFIKAKKRLIALLKEQKQVIINDAVTGKIDVRTGKPYPKYKDSGVEWLGMVPVEWEIRKLRTILFQKTLKNRPSSPLLSVVREKGVIVRNIEDFEENRNFIPDDLTSYKFVRIGQFAMNKMKAWQGSYGVSKYEGIVSPAYFVFDINFENLDFFNYAIRSKFYVGYFGKSSDGIRIGQWDLSLQKMKEIPFLVPPAHIQADIVKFVPRAFKNIENSIVTIEKEIDLLQEYRTRLIADVVTGKVDVRNVSVPVNETDTIDEEADENDIEEFENPDVNE